MSDKKLASLKAPILSRPHIQRLVEIDPKWLDENGLLTKMPYPYYNLLEAAIPSTERATRYVGFYVADDRASAAPGDVRATGHHPRLDVLLEVIIRDDNSIVQELPRKAKTYAYIKRNSVDIDEGGARRKLIRYLDAEGNTTWRVTEEQVYVYHSEEHVPDGLLPSSVREMAKRCAQMLLHLNHRIVKYDGPRPSRVNGFQDYPEQVQHAPLRLSLQAEQLWGNRYDGKPTNSQIHLYLHLKHCLKNFHTHPITMERLAALNDAWKTCCDQTHGRFLFESDPTT